MVHTQIQGCFSASDAVILLAGLTVSILFMRFFASGVTVSHSGDGYWKKAQTWQSVKYILLLLLLLVVVVI